MIWKRTIRLAWFGAALAILLISGFQFVVPISELHWHNVFQHLYYLPIVVAALSSGWPGGLAAGVLAGLSNVPHNILALRILPSYAIDQIFDIPIFCAAGLLTGVLAERGRKQRTELERTTKRLTEVYQELQRNFEQMKRSERLFAVGQLSAGLAHEIRNPLASIAGAAGILQRNSAPDRKNMECLEIITRECQRLNRLLGNFLDFARPRTPHYQQVDIVPVLDSVLELARHAPGKQRIEFRKDVSPRLPALESDPELLKQVLLNLVMNAIQAMPDGGDVLVSAAPQHERIVIQVKDAGEGIKPENLDRIFDPFFTTKDNGSGLGLSVAHQIIEQHGGMLTAAANSDRGMTFTVSLPLRHARQDEAE